MEFRRINSGGSEISNITYLSENAYALESEGSSCVPVQPFKPVPMHRSQVKEASSGLQVRVFAQSSHTQPPISGSVNPHLQRVILPSQYFPVLGEEKMKAAGNEFHQRSLLPSHFFPEFMSMKATRNESHLGSHQQDRILAPRVFQFADAFPAAAMPTTTSPAVGRFTPFLLEQINKAVPRSPTPTYHDLLILNKNSCPAPHRANYDLNSPDGTVRFSIAPVTPDRDGRVENGQPSGKDAAEVSREQSLFQSVNSLPTTMFCSQQRAENQGLSQQLHSVHTVVSQPSPMVFQEFLSSPIDQNQGLSQPTEAFPSVIREGQQNLLQTSGFPSTPIKETQVFQPVDLSPAANPVPVADQVPVKGKNRIDLNKVPAQKPPRKKKHRPKVIREDKPKKPPKPKTPKPAANKEGQKRKYVRKTGPKVASMPQSTDVRETGNPEKQSSKRSCRRSLNFNSQVHRGDQENGNSNDVECGWQEVNMTKIGLSCATGLKPTLQIGTGIEVYPLSHIAVNLNSSVNHVLEKYISLPDDSSSPMVKDDTSKESTGNGHDYRDSGHDYTDSGHGTKTPIHESVQPSEVNYSSGHHNATHAMRLSIHESKHPSEVNVNCSLYDHNGAHSMGLPIHESVQLSKVNLNSPGHHNAYAMGPPIHESVQLSKVNLNSPGHHNAYAMGPPIHESVQPSEVNHPSGNHKGHIMGLNYIRNPMSSPISRLIDVPVQLHQNILQLNKHSCNNGLTGVMAHPALQHWPFSPLNVIKDRFAENNGHPRAPLTENPVKNLDTFSGRFAQLDREMTINHHQHIHNGGLLEIKNIQSSLLEQEHIERRKKQKSNPPIKSHKRILSAPVVIPPQQQQTRSTHGAIGSTVNVDGTLALVETLANILPKIKRKRRTRKMQVRMEEAHASYQVPHQGSIQSIGTELRQQKLTKRKASLHKDDKSVTTLALPISIEQGGSNVQCMSQTGFQLQLCKVVEEIICGVQRLNIGTENPLNVENTENALVPFTGEGTMVLYKSQADSGKKRRPRAKVDLDEETNRVWKLLMWKEGSDGTEGIDEEKEKYWEEQRQIFRGRADSFIARMHLVQGDRRFSPWKGSVVDSVVGVFLTQNVSDHLSSSAFMALAARFPQKLRGENTASNEGKGAPMEESVSNAEIQEPIKQQDKPSSPQAHESASMEESVSNAEIQESIRQQHKPYSPQASDQSSLRGAGFDYTKELTNCNESFGSNDGNSTQNSKIDSLTYCISEAENYQESSDNKTDASIGITESPCLVDLEKRKVEDYVMSSQASIVSSQNSTDSIPQATDRFGSTSESNSEAENLMNKFECNPYDRPFSFMELLEMALSLEHNNHGNGMPFSVQNSEDAYGQCRGSECDQTSLRFNGMVLPKACPSNGEIDYLQQQEHHMFSNIFSKNSDDYHLQTQLSTEQMDMTLVGMPLERRPLPSPACAIGERDVYSTREIVAVNEIQSRAQQDLSLGSQNALTSNFLELLTKNSVHPFATSEVEACHVRNPAPNNILLMERNENVNRVIKFNHKMGEPCLQTNFTVVPGCKGTIEVLTQKEIPRIQENTSNLANYIGDSLDDESSGLAHEKNIDELKYKTESCTSKVASAQATKNTPKAKRGRNEAEKKQDFDWDSLRREACCNGQKERTSNRMDSLDWEAVRLAEVSEVSKTIKERGMNNMLAERIKDFLNRLVEDHGSIDLEWLRDIPPEKAKEYLLSIRGLGLKSVECVRLLTLHHLAFPVDTNVGRICVRLGWVPLQPLPESLQLHLLELYPMLENIQKYLWPRLCTLDQRMLYELHYQMITFGKVFCTKSKPNCNSCPMRAECRHFASAFASARLALPGPEEKSLVTATIPLATKQNENVFINRLPLPLPRANPGSQIGSENKTIPFIEEPSTPEPEYKEVSEADIEDAFWEDPDEIPTIKLNIEELSVNVQNYMQENNMEDFDVSKALVALSPEAASIPVPKLKNVSRLRTEHQVYELPDSHPLLEGLGKREPDDPCSYLLAIWTPGETAQSTQLPESCCSRQPGQLCDNETCFSCNSMREANAQCVRGTLLIPCRTAMRGSFPLNGTYFQVNEVFADHDSSIKPMDVPRSWIWNLSRKTVYFGTSVTTIFRGLSTEGIQHCFWRGFVCVRGFDQKTRAPRPLMARLHFPASKLVKNNRKTTKDRIGNVEGSQKQNPNQDLS